ncbi:MULTISPECIES: HNH endonuclease [unclassified Nocardia]|uniref:HNH endonuclease n=1 Tax=unclassified Nocardia TaxID=2637762 RepID=UPI00278BFD83|nr:MULTISPECIES: hypothetical protein [unclassified Nocardia]
MRSTDPPAALRAAIAERSAGLCERCGAARAVLIHHRRPRGMGGSRRSDTNTFPNLLHICSPCHDRIESRRDDAERHGWLVPQGDDPETHPVRYRGQPVWLRGDGGVDFLDTDEQEFIA